MKKDELIQQMADGADITKIQATKALSSLIEGISDALKEEDGKITLMIALLSPLEGRQPHPVCLML